MARGERGGIPAERPMELAGVRWRSPGAAPAVEGLGQRAQAAPANMTIRPRGHGGKPGGRGSIRGEPEAQTQSAGSSDRSGKRSRHAACSRGNVSPPTRAAIAYSVLPVSPGACRTR